MNYRTTSATSAKTRRFSLLISLVLASVLAGAATIATTFAATEANVAEPAIIIHEVKSGGSNTTPAEYVTVYNKSDQPVSLDGWTAEYAKLSFPVASCGAADWKAVSTPNVTISPLSGTVAAHGLSAAFAIAINNDAAGSLHITNTNQQVMDLVGWGSESSHPACKETTQAPMLNSNKSLVRYTGCTSAEPVDSNDNSADFDVSVTPEPTQISTRLPASCISISPEPGQGEIATSCQGLKISELLPNPAGTDTGNEYIELHNTSVDTIDASACSLQTSANSKLYALSGISLAPDQYYKLSDSQSGLTLSNASGGTVWLVDEEQELLSTTYPADMEDGTSWSYADGQWVVSYAPTPGLANIIVATKPCPEGQIRNSETNRCVNITNSTDDAVLVACDPGQERNPETNRCRNITTSTAATCPAGQVRNTETNRCRTATAAATTQVACKAGQERNPETNRCRNITTTTAAKACPAGQERSPDTNRCRKITAAASGKNGSGLAGVSDVAANAIQQHKPYWLIAAGVLVAAIGYGIYEWRQEISMLWSKRFSMVNKPLRL